MNKYIAAVALLLTIIAVGACHKDQPEEYSPVTLDLSKVPYEKLSEYNFFEGALKDQKPAKKVLPYKPASGLFSDYAHKKRFVWLPEGTQAHYNGDDNIFDFPVGAVLIKTFYYDNVLPANETKMIETRLLIMTTAGWKAYTYVWNADQTEATLESTNNGVIVPVSFLQDGQTRNISFRVPSQTQCITCHKINPTHSTGGEITIPIAPKPQNLNTDYDYGGTVQNQLSRWRAEGYIGNDTPDNAAIYSTVNWEDTSQPLELRARSYIDMNCAHCHRDGGHCDYTNMRFNFSNQDMARFGVCMTPLFNIPNAPYVINSGRANRSELIVRISSIAGSEMMPIIGRSVVHTEGVQLITDWINSMPSPCQ